MIKVSTKVPRDVYVAVSGGVDSMAALDFLKHNHIVTAVFVNHRTPTSKQAKEVVKKYCKKYDLQLVKHKIGKDKPKDQSYEEWWRNERYAFLDQLDKPVVTAHHLDDCVETWVWSSMHGTPKLPQTIRGNVIRPFLQTKKDDLIEWAKTRGLEYAYDESNDDTKYMRNYIRHTVMPHILKINPGIQKMVFKKLMEK